MHVQSETEGLGVLILTGQLISLRSLRSLGIRRGQQSRKFCASFENNNNIINRWPRSTVGHPGGWEFMSLWPLSDMFSRSRVSSHFSKYTYLTYRTAGSASISDERPVCAARANFSRAIMEGKINPSTLANELVVNPLER